jgi:hypothetical protein
MKAMAEEHYRRGCDALESGRRSPQFRRMYGHLLQGQRVIQSNNQKTILLGTLFDSEDGGRIFFQNVGEHLHVIITSQRRVACTVTALGTSVPKQKLSGTHRHRGVKFRIT